MRSVTSGLEASSKNLSLNHAISRRTSTRSPLAVGFIEVLGDDSGAGNRQLALCYQHRRGGRGIERQKRLAPLPGPLFHQPQIEAVFSQRQADEARMRTERMMKQREHEVLGHFAVIKRPSPSEAGQTTE